MNSHIFVNKTKGEGKSLFYILTRTITIEAGDFFHLPFLLVTEAPCISLTLSTEGRANQGSSLVFEIYYYLKPNIYKVTGTNT